MVFFSYYHHLIENEFNPWIYIAESWMNSTTQFANIGILNLHKESVHFHYLCSWGNELGKNKKTKEQMEPIMWAAKCCLCDTFVAHTHSFKINIVKMHFSVYVPIVIFGFMASFFLSILTLPWHSPAMKHKKTVANIFKWKTLVTSWKKWHRFYYRFMVHIVNYIIFKVVHIS